MRFVLYGLAWVCILVAAVFAGFAITGPWYGHLAKVMLVVGLLFGVAGNIVVRKTTRKCTHCGERTDRFLAVCQNCGTSLSGWAQLQRH
ncbi:hypothetical protein GCM10028796_09220 [Ramlibacter monticola]|uniref:Uncharacterized protein n=1 Tax=Ramlibacter monticola TaxID=1926872 RepID=A0A936YSP8_9BURK|nr:hypothetical protein [Ramlibacter monticola]MBL0389780.1 hypothetical protein [Ramlibacter monticola]